MNAIHIDSLDRAPRVLDWRHYALLGAFVLVAVWLAPLWLLALIPLFVIVDMVETLWIMHMIQWGDIIENDGYMQW